MKITHEMLTPAIPLLVKPTDYKAYGGEVERWEKPGEEYPDCSCGCKWYATLEGSLGYDWGVCANRNAPRFGLLTFEHQAGKGCFESDGVAELDNAAAF